MKTIFIIRREVLQVLVLTAIIMLSETMIARGAERSLSDQMRSLIGKSSMTAAEKTELLAAADRAVKAGVPTDDVELIIARGQERGVDAATTGGLLDTASTVRKQGLPLRPVLSRIEQGLAKGVPPEKISRASRTLAERLAEAQPLVNGLIRDGVTSGAARDREYAVETAARALEQSMTKETLTAVGSRVKERGGSVSLFDKAVHTLTRLVEQGMSAEAASRVVHSALGRGFSERDLTKMEREIVQGLGKGKQRDEGVKQAEPDRKKEQAKDGQKEGNKSDRDERRGKKEGDEGRGKERDEESRLTGPDLKEEQTGGMRKDENERFREELHGERERAGGSHGSSDAERPRDGERSGRGRER